MPTCRYDYLVCRRVVYIDYSVFLVELTEGEEGSLRDTHFSGFRRSLGRARCSWPAAQFVSPDRS